MAFSLGDRLLALVQIEASYGGGGSGFSNTADSIIVYDNSNPVQVGTNIVEVQPLRTSLTDIKALIGRQVHNLSLISYLQGVTTLSPIAQWRFSRLLRACALQEVTSTGSSVFYLPRASGFESAAMKIYPDGWEHDINAIYGNTVFEASAGTPVKTTFTGIGNVPANVPIKNVALPTGATFETLKALTWQSAALVLRSGAYTLTGGWAAAIPTGIVNHSGGTLLSPTAFVKSFRFDLGVQMQERLDANSVNAFAGELITRRRPRLQLVIEADGNPNVDFFADWRNGTPHFIQFNYGTASLNQVEFDFMYAQLLNVQWSLDGQLRTWTLDYKIQSANAEDEFMVKFI